MGRGSYEIDSFVEKVRISQFFSGAYWVLCAKEIQWKYKTVAELSSSVQMELKYFRFPSTQKVLNDSQLLFYHHRRFHSRIPCHRIYPSLVLGRLESEIGHFLMSRYGLHMGPTDIISRGRENIKRQNIIC